MTRNTAKVIITRSQTRKMPQSKPLTKEEIMALFRENDAKAGALSISKNLAMAFDVTEEDTREVAATVYLLAGDKETMAKGVIVRRVREAYITDQKHQGLALFLLGTLMAPMMVVVPMPNLGPRIGEAS